MRSRNRKSKGNAAIIYTRVSDPRQVENTSLSNQEQQCVEYCNKKGYKLTRTFPEDTGRTGRNADRPSFQQAIKHARESDDVGHFVVLRFNRFYRNTKLHHVDYDVLLDDYGVRVESVLEDCNTDSAEHKRVRAMIAANAEYESDDISEKARMGMLRARADGRLTNQPPMGLKRVFDHRGNSMVKHDRYYASAVRRMFQMYDEGKLQKEILETFNAEGFRTPSNNRLSCKQLTRILGNIKYAGFVPVDDDIPPAVGDFEPIVDIALFERVQRRLNVKTSSNPTTYTSDRVEFPLRRFLRCSQCGNPLTGSFSTGKSGKKYSYYHCRNCRGVSVRADVLNNSFKELLSSFSVSAELMEFLNAVGEEYWEDDVMRKEKEASRLIGENKRDEKRKEKLIEMVLDGTISDKDMKVYMTKIEFRQRRLEILKTCHDPTDLRQQRNHCIKLIQNLANLWDRGPPEVRLALQSAVFPESIIMDKNTKAFTVQNYSEGLSRA